jgi:hypothetical protein
MLRMTLSIYKDLISLTLKDAGFPFDRMSMRLFLF